MTKAEVFFEAILLQSGDPEYAVRFVCIQIERDLRSGDDVQNIGTAWGISQDALYSYDRDHLIRRLVDEPASILDIPDSKCINDHLPKDRPPTAQDIRKALKACQK